MYVITYVFKYVYRYVFKYVWISPPKGHPLENAHAVGARESRPRLEAAALRPGWSAALLHLPSFLVRWAGRKFKKNKARI